MASMKKRAREEIDVEEDGPPAKKLSPLEEARARIAAMKAEIAAKEQQKKELLAISDLMEKPIEAVEECKMAVAQLRKSSYAAIDGEWTGRGREAKLCLLQVSFPLDGDRKPGIYLFDALVGGKAMFEAGGLKALLEDDKFLKILHDCRLDSDVLFHSFGVTLNGVIDTQVLYYYNFTQLHPYSPLPVSLKTLLRKYAGFEPEGDLKAQAHALMEANANFWEIRPMSEMMLQYAREDVLYLLHAYKRLWSGLDPRNHELAQSTSKAYVRQVRSMKEFPHDRYNGTNKLPTYGIELWDRLAKAHWEYLNTKYPHRFKTTSNSETPDEKDMKKLELELKNKAAQSNTQESVASPLPSVTAPSKPPKSLFFSSEKRAQPLQPQNTKPAPSKPSGITIHRVEDLSQ